MFAKIRFYWGAFVISSIIALVMIPAIMLFNEKKGIIMHKLNRFILFCLGAKVQQEGEMDESADIYIFNHQGIIDIIAMEALQRSHLRWVAKRELFEARWFGNLLKYAQMIAVNRESKSSLVKLIKDIDESYKRYGRKVAIFPEGTRADKQELLPFKAGTKIVVQKLKLKVQPVVIVGSKWVLNEHNKTAHSGTVRYIFLPTVDVKETSKDWHAKIQRDMQKAIDEQLTNHNRSR